MKVIYLASFQANHPNFDVTYQDINGKRDIGGDMLDVDLSPYDVIIATPPCNYYSRANQRRETSEYAQKTKHLLPSIIKKLIGVGKPFIVENVLNSVIFKSHGLYDLPLYIYLHGRHTYWTNIFFNPSSIKQSKDGIGGVKWFSANKRQGGQNVHNVIDYWLESVRDTYFRVKP